ATFDADLAAALNATALLTNHAVLFNPNAGGHAGQTFLVVDANATAGYQAGQDLVVRLEAPLNLGSLDKTDFI
ncbi:MAG: hypothetical protein KIS73_25080, partial [Enhydrobacter sp.]|nr:hypothetical protein [Enhydrobacter sp.]